MNGIAQHQWSPGKVLMKTQGDSRIQGNLSQTLFVPKGRKLQGAVLYVLTVCKWPL